MVCASRVPGCAALAGQSEAPRTGTQRPGAAVHMAALPPPQTQRAPRAPAWDLAQGLDPARAPASLSAAPQTPGPAPGAAKDPARLPPGGSPSPAQATPGDGSADTELVLACKARALALLRRKSPEIEDIFIDMDGLTIATAELAVGDTQIRTVMMGEAYIQRDKTDRIHRFLCLTGEKGEVLLTFFTER